MALPLRLEFSGALYHVTSRGDGREDIFVGDVPRTAWRRPRIKGAGIKGAVVEFFLD